MRLLLACFFISVLASHAAPPAGPDLAPVKAWIARQADFHSVSADFTQTRALKALRSPLSTPGHLFFQTPDSFRWELGDPVKTIVLRKGESVYLINVAKKRAEHQPTTQTGQAQGIQAMTMMKFPLAKDFADYQRQFETLAVEVSGDLCHLELLPRNAQARKMLAALKIDFELESGHMRSFEIVTRDGSSLRNEFSNVRHNPKLDRKTFSFDFTDYEVVEAK